MFANIAPGCRPNPYAALSVWQEENGTLPAEAIDKLLSGELLDTSVEDPFKSDAPKEVVEPCEDPFADTLTGPDWYDNLDPEFCLF